MYIPHLECTISAYDITEKYLEKQMISRFTMLGYDLVGILGVPSRMIRFFRFKPLKLGMHYESYQDYFESIEEDVDRIVSPELRDDVRNALRLETILEALKESSVYEYSVDIMTRDGRHRHKLLQYSYFDETHDVIFVCRSDVTSQYQREHEQIDQLRTAKLAAERANEAKSTFLASVSHDLRTPLNGVVGFTELALNETNTKKKQEYMEKVRSSSTLLLDLVNDTLELSRIESGKSVCIREAVDLREISEAVLTSLQPSAEIKSLEFHTDLSKCPKVIVWTDRLKYQKIFLNVLSNAIKYTPSSGRIDAKVIWNAKAEDGNTCHITVKDTGIGIRKEFLPHIFDSFSQDVRPETKNIQGTGLGLAIVKHMVDQLNGTISVKSKVNKGTEFDIDLPLALADRQKTQKKWNSDKVDLTGMHILLCEDNSLNVEIAKAILLSKDAKVEVAANGEEAVKKFKKSAKDHYDLILMDIRMPVMDGFDAAAAIRACRRPDAELPIIAMTADAFKEDIRHFRKVGMNEYVTKPINPESLFKVISKCTTKKKKKQNKK